MPESQQTWWSPCLWQGWTKRTLHSGPRLGFQTKSRNTNS